MGWPFRAFGYSWHEYMGHANRVSSPDLPGILVRRVGCIDSAGFGPERASDVSDVLARRVPVRRQHGTKGRSGLERLLDPGRQRRADPRHRRDLLDRCLADPFG